MTEEHVSISSLVIDTVPEKTDVVAEALAQIEGVEVHGKDAGQVVITIEKETTSEMQECANGFSSIDGVINVNLIYFNFEDDPEIQAKFEKLQAKADKGAGASEQA